MESSCFENSFSFTQQDHWNARQNPAKNPVGPKSEDSAIIGLVRQKMRSQTDTRTKNCIKIAN